ncbi:putative ankyrin repeat protein [Hypoxylon sp. FL1857]|nr:putative ankyrin repeat protein [Hypoxylon sp. FL1857]
MSEDTPSMDQPPDPVQGLALTQESEPNDLGASSTAMKGGKDGRNSDEKDDDDGDDDESVRTGTTDLLSPFLDEPPPSEPPKRKLGLDINKPLGWTGSKYVDYDIITVHGIRDDYNTAWIDKDGGWWLRTRLFKDLSTRQVDYAYAIEEDSDIFQQGGVLFHAEILITKYAQIRAELDETETDRPVIWVCHDIGGTIIKEALSLGIAHPEKYGKIAILTTAIIFLGCPHRALSMDDLEDQLHRLILLPGPAIRHRALLKVKHLATQVQVANENFLDSKLLDRAVIVNVFSQNIRTSIGHRDIDQDAEYISKVTGPYDELPDPSTPFPRYAHFIGQSFESCTRFSARSTDHVDLIKGDSHHSWISTVSKLFNTTAFPIKVNYHILQFQAGILSLLPPTKATKLDLDPLKPRHPVVAWIRKQDAFAKFSRPLPGPKVMHLHGNGNLAVNVTELSQHFYLDYDLMISIFPKRVPANSIVFFEFDRLDSRYNKLSTMLLYFINAIVWRLWSDQDPAIRGELSFLNRAHALSLGDLYHLYKTFINHHSAANLTFFISRFDHCQQGERTWFLERILDMQSYSERSYRMIITTSSRDDLAIDLFPDDARINLEDCPELRQSVSSAVILDELSQSLEALIRKRPVYKGVRGEIETLLKQCCNAPHLGHSILKWLGHFKRGTPKGSITNIIKKLTPVTPQNLIDTFISSLDSEKRSWAKKIYHWVKYAAEPWTPESLAEALAIHKFPTEPPLDDLDALEFMKDIEEVFGGMIIVDDHDIKLSHDSYLDLSDIDIAEDPEEHAAKINSQIAEVCLCYLGLRSIQERTSTLLADRYIDDTHMAWLYQTVNSYWRNNMIEYATRFWPVHYKRSGKFKPKRLVRDLFSNKENREAWEVFYHIISNPFTRIQRCYISPLPVFAMLDLEDLLDEQLDIERHLPSFDKNCWLAITEAARAGNDCTVQSLLQQVTEVDEQELQSALFWAAAHGTSSSVEKLLMKIPDLKTFSWPNNLMYRAAAAGLNSIILAMVQSGCNINELEKYYGAPTIAIAAWWDQVSTVKALIDSDIQPDLTIRDRDGDTPFLTAVTRGNPRMIDLFLRDPGIVHQQSTSDNVNAVQLAAKYGKHKAIELLVKVAADLKNETSQNSDTDSPKPPLIHAVRIGFRECVRVLLDNGADPNVRCKSGSALSEAVERNDIDIVRMLLEKNADLNHPDDDEATLLMRAVQTGNTDLVSLLIQHGAKVDLAEDSDDICKTPLSLAASLGNMEMVNLLLDKRADVNFCGAGSDSPLFSALYTNKPDIAKIFIDRGADVHWAAEDGWGPLHAAYRIPGVIPELLKRGADVNKPCKHGTVTMMAARYGFWETIEALIKHGDPKPDLEIVYDNQTVKDNIGFTALLIACKQKYSKCVKVLLDAGANPGFRNADGDNALDICVREGSSKESEECVKLLLTHNPIINFIDDQGNTILHKVQSSTLSSIVKLLVDAGALMDTQNEAGYTPLAIAIRENNVDVAKYLIDQKASINVYSPTFGSLLHLACHGGSIELVTLLIEAKADPSTVNPEFGESLLYTALGIEDSKSRVKMIRHLVDEIKIDINAIGGRFRYPIIRAAYESRSETEAETKILKFLIRRKADLNVADDQGRRAVHLATLSPWDYGLRSLVEAGADINAKDQYGRSPVHFAASCDFSDCMNYLLEKGVNIHLADQDGWTPLMWAARSGTHRTIRRLVEKGADLWARGHSYSTDWSALKLANFYRRNSDATELLVPKSLTREGPNGKPEKWDKFFHKSRFGSLKNGDCWSCFVTIRGIQWKCIECAHDVSLCFKCYSHRSTMHDPEHNFEEIGPLYYEDHISSENGFSSDVEPPNHEGAQSTGEAPPVGEESILNQEDRDGGDAPIPSDDTVEDDAEFDPDNFDMDAEDVLE